MSGHGESGKLWEEYSEWEVDLWVRFLLHYLHCQGADRWIETTKEADVEDRRGRGRRMSSGREPRVVGRREGGRARLDGWMDDNSFHLWWWCVHVA